MLSALFAVIVVPAGMVKLTPAGTLKIPDNSYETLASKVVSSCNSPSKVLLTGQAFEHVPPQSTPCSPTSKMPFEHRLTGSGSVLLSTLEQLEIIKPKDDNKIIVNFKNLVFISS